MERPENIKRDKQFIGLIILFHLVGLIGLAIPFSGPLFLQLVSYHLLLMGVIIILSHQAKDWRLLLFILIVGGLGFYAEWLGVNKALLFGNYQYGPTLGPKFDHVPLTIAINWFLLIYSTGVLMQRSRIKNILLRIIAGALLLVLLDLIIEPVAIRLNYWHWANNTIPVKNYICWFLFSSLLLAVFEMFGFKKQSMVAPVLLILQFVFFGILNMW